MSVLFRSDAYMQEALHESYESTFYSSQLIQIDQNDLRDRITNVLFNVSVLVGAEVARKNSTNLMKFLFVNAVVLIENNAVNCATTCVSEAVAGYFGLDPSLLKCAANYTVKPFANDIAKSTRNTRLEQLWTAGSYLCAQSGIDNAVASIHLAQGVTYAGKLSFENSTDVIFNKIMDAKPKKNYYRSIKPWEVGMMDSLYHMACNIAIYVNQKIGCIKGFIADVDITTLIEDSIKDDSTENQPKLSFASIARQLEIEDVTLTRYESPALESILRAREQIGNSVYAAASRAQQAATSMFNSLVE